MNGILFDRHSIRTQLTPSPWKKKKKKLRTSDAGVFGVGEGGYFVTYIEPIWKAIRYHFSKPTEMLPSSNSRLLLTGNIQQKGKKTSMRVKRDSSQCYPQ